MHVSCDGVDLACDFVLSATGIVPNSQIASDAGLELGPKNTIAVDRYLRSSDPDIYAAGDCSDAYHVLSGKKTWIRARSSKRPSGSKSCWTPTGCLC